MSASHAKSSPRCKRTLAVQDSQNFQDERACPSCFLLEPNAVPDWSFYRVVNRPSQNPHFGESIKLSGPFQQHTTATHA